jgi:preprotein translocase subunit Sec61beta
MAIVLGNRAKMSTSTTGTGTITLGSALSGYQTFAQAGITNGQTVRYTIEDGTNFEIGSGVFTSSGTTLTRNVTESSNSDNAINLSGSGEVFITASAADIFVNDGATSLTTTGVGTFASLDISGDIDVDGTTNLDAVDIDGAVNIAADLTIASTNKILFNDASQFIQGSSATVLTIAATDEIDLTATTIDINGAVALNGAVTGATNVTLSGELDAATGDFATSIAVANVGISTGVIDLQNGGSQSVVRFYCESSNAHYAQIQAPAHGSFSGNVTLTLPATTDTIAGIAATQTFTNKTLTTPVLTTPIANAGIQLKNGSTSAGFLEFFEDSDNGTNKVTLIGPASTADVTITLPAAADTLVGKATTDTLTNKTLTTPVVNAGAQLKNGATSAGFLQFFEDSDNGTNKVTLIGPASTADITLTLPATAGTIATTVSAADEATALAIALG